MRKATKTIISFAVILIAGLNFIVPAFAQDPFTAVAIGGLTGASGAGLFGSMAGMSGINIGWSQSGSDPMDAMWNVLNPDHVYFSGEKHEADPQTDPDDIWDYITVDLGDWLSAQSDFIINFAQTYNVSDNDSGSVNTTIICGIPVSAIGSGSAYYQSDPMYVTAVGSFSFGPFTITCDRIQGDRAFGSFSSPYFNTRSCNWLIATEAFYLISNQNKNNVSFGNATVTKPISNLWTTQTVNNPTSDTETISWSSGNVNTSVFDGWENAKVKIPHSISGLTAGWTVPDFTNALNDLWDQGLQGQIVIEDTDQPVPPPTPVPVPSTPLGEVPFDDWVDLWGQGIYEQLENQSDALDFIGSAGEDAVEELESIDTSIQDLGETAESIDTNIGVGNGILGGIRSLAQSAVNYLEGIAEHVGELVEEIVEGTETLIAGILNQIPQVFSVIFGPIKQASSIWHYVVEWITSIGAPFQFIWSMASGTSYYIILPVYASLAAAVVLAFYKRFGK